MSTSWRIEPLASNPCLFLRFNQHNRNKKARSFLTRVAPNPADKNLIVKKLHDASTEITLIRLIVLSGEVFVPTIINWDRNFVELDVKDIPLGIYILEVHSDGLVEQRKIIINR